MPNSDDLYVLHYCNSIILEHDPFSMNWRNKMPEHSGEVSLIRVPGGINAQSIIAALKGHGIPARSQGESVGAIYGLTLDGLGEEYIFVSAEDLEKARDVLAAGEHGDLFLNDSDMGDNTDI
jgi:hypothetical protein